MQATKLGFMEEKGHEGSLVCSLTCIKLLLWSHKTETELVGQQAKYGES